MKSHLSLFPSLTLCALLLGGCASNEAAQTTASVPVANALSPQGSTNFTSKEAKFAIYFPGQVKQTQKSGSSLWGEYQIFTFSSRTPTTGYDVVVTTIPSSVDISEPATFIDDLQTGFLKGSHATLEKSRDVTLSGTPGRELTTHMQVGSINIKSRIFLYFTPHISYQVMAIGLDSDPKTKSDESDKVLRSFRLLDQ